LQQKKFPAKKISAKKFLQKNFCKKIFFKKISVKKFLQKNFYKKISAKKFLQKNFYKKKIFLNCQSLKIDLTDRQKITNCASTPFSIFQRPTFCVPKSLFG